MSLTNKIKILTLTSTISAFLVWLVWLWMKRAFGGQDWDIYGVIPFIYVMLPAYLVGLITTPIITFIKIKDSTGSRVLFSISSLLLYFVVFYLLNLLLR